MTVEEEVVAHGKQNEDIGFKHQAAKQLGKSCLGFNRVLGEQLLELVDDEERVFVAPTPVGDCGDHPVKVLWLQEGLHRIGIARQLGNQCPAQREKCCISGIAGDDRPTASCVRNDSRPDERGLTCSRRPHNSEQVRPVELAPYLLDLGLRAEEVLGVFLGE